jgi:hypothetical protein
METVINILGSEATMSLIVTILGAIWTMFKGSEWYATHMSEKRRRAIEVLELAVHDTYDTYVRAIKASNEDGKLTEEEKTAARQKAVDKAIAIGRSKGIDIAGELGQEALSAWVTKIVSALKQKSAQPITMKEAVERLLGPIDKDNKQ